MLYCSTETSTLADDPLPLDANSYPSFKTVDTTVLQQITCELESLGEMEEERTPHVTVWRVTR